MSLLLIILSKKKLLLNNNKNKLHVLSSNRWNKSDSIRIDSTILGLHNSTLIIYTIIKND